MSQQINLFNPIFLKQKKYFSAVTMVQALGLLVIGMLLLNVFAVRQTNSLERLLAATGSSASQQREQLIGLTKQYSDRGVSKQLEQDIARVEGRLRTRAQLLSEIQTGVGGNVDGFSRYLEALARRTMDGVWLTGIEAGKGNELVIKGRALNAELVPAYLQTLSRERVFAGRALSALHVEARSGMRFVEFTVRIPGAAEGGAS